MAAAGRILTAAATRTGTEEEMRRVTRGSVATEGSMATPTSGNIGEAHTSENTGDLHEPAISRVRGCRGRKS
jgi:hypothetical protein